MNWQDIKNIIKEELKEVQVTAGDANFTMITGVNKNDTKLGIKIQFEPPVGLDLPSDKKSKLEVALQTKLNKGLAQYDIQVSKDTDVPRKEVIGFFIPLKQIKNLIVKSIKSEGLNEGLNFNEADNLKTELSTKIAGIVKNFTSGMEIKADDASRFRDMLQEINMEVNATLNNAIDQNPLNESSGVIDKIAGGIPYRYEGDGRTGQAIISEPLDDDTKTRIIKRAKQAGYSAKPNMGGGVTIIITGKERKLNEGILNEMRVRDLNEISKVVMRDDFYGFINAGNNILRSLEDKEMHGGKKYLVYLVKHNIM